MNIKSLRAVVDSFNNADNNFTEHHRRKFCDIIFASIRKNRQVLGLPQYFSCHNCHKIWLDKNDDTECPECLSGDIYPVQESREWLQRKCGITVGRSLRKELRGAGAYALRLAGKGLKMGHD